MSTALSTAVDPSGLRKAGRFLRRVWWIALLALLLAFLTTLAIRPPLPTERDHPENPNPNGMRAIAEILRSQGVEVRVVGTAADAAALIETGRPATVLVTDLDRLQADAAAIRNLQADVVLQGSPYLASLSSYTSVLSTSTAGSSVNLFPECDDLDAVAAGRITMSQGSVASETATICFPVPDGGGAYAVWEQNGHTWRYFADLSILRNSHLAEDGNAALGLRALGHHPLLVWIVPTVVSNTVIAQSTPFFAPWFEPALLVGAGVVLLLIIAGGGRLGRVVTEPLPVVVRPGETVIGRGTLYRRSGTYAHSAQALRAGMARRAASAVGLPRAAGPDAVVTAIANATGRPRAEVQEMIYGVPPATATQFSRLAAALKELENEIR